MPLAWGCPTVGRNRNGILPWLFIKETLCTYGHARVLVVSFTGTEVCISAQASTMEHKPVPWMH